MVAERPIVGLSEIGDANSSYIASHVGRICRHVDLTQIGTHPLTERTNEPTVTNKQTNTPDHNTSRRI